MKWESVAIDRLRDYEKRKLAVENIPEQIAILEDKFIAIRAATTDGTPVQDSNNRREEMLIYNIARREELKQNYKLAVREVALTEKGLAALTSEEREILEGFYIYRTKNYVNRLCDELYVSKTELYRRKDAALRNFTVAIYGIVEL